MPKFALPLLLCLGFVSIAWAKRSPPEPVAPVKSGNIEYRVDHRQMGCVEAWDLEHKEMLWRRQIYTVRYQPDLERDVQDVFITAIELKDKTLTVKNERQSAYALDLDSLDVKVVAGRAVEGK